MVLELVPFRFSYIYKNTYLTGFDTPPIISVVSTHDMDVAEFAKSEADVPASVACGNR